jgi:glutamate-5-semialdehyde dehydrogenase
VEVRGCEITKTIVPGIILATEEDWATEYLDLKITIKVVTGFAEAVSHINQYSTHLADGIVTEEYAESWKFINAVDSAATYVNASTRFTDGGEFGLGAEIGINTSKIHGMGPMGVEGLTVTKYIVFGEGQIR